MTALTPIYGLPYLVPGQPARDLRVVIQGLAEATEDALQGAGLAAPGASDLLAVSGRVSTLEAMNPAAWTAISLASPWTSYAAPATYPTISYRVEGRRVHLRGWALNSSAVAAAAFITAVALPVAVRPAQGVTVWGVNASTLGLVRLELSAAGHLQVQAAQSATTYIDLSMIQWGL